MTVEEKCANCKQLGARSICTEAQSPQHGRRVESTDSCAHFICNPAAKHFSDGLVAMLSVGQSLTVIDELEKAIALGLPEDTEMQARYCLGYEYQEIAGRTGLPAEQMVRLPEFTRALSEEEKAVRMDRDGAYGYFLRPLNRARLGSLDLLYALQSRRLAGELGQQAAIAFLEEKLGLCDYLSTSPFLQVLLDLGNLYAESGAKDKAVACFERIIRAEPVNIGDEGGLEAETRAMAAGNLSILSGQSLTGRSAGSGCMLIVSLICLALMGACSVSIFP